MVDKKNIEDFYPLSPMQQGMLFHTLYAPGSGMYVEQEVYALRGELDVTALRQAWQRVVERHPILRTAFVGEGLKEPIQRVHRRIDLRFEEEDWRGRPSADRDAELAERSEADRRQGFVLSDPPLFRVLLARMEDDEYRLVWTYHHILLDGWSVPVLLQEILLFYEALRRGDEISLPEPRPYRDYIVWLKRQDPERAEGFWRGALQGVTGPTPLPFGHLTSGDGDEARYDMAVGTLEPSLTAALKEASRRHGLTLSTVVHGVWALLLSRHCGSDDVMFGTAVSGRPPDLEGADSMVGLFINTLPIRARITPQVSVANWLRGLQDQLAELRQYEYSPLIDVQSYSEVPRGTPLFESIVAFENYPTPAGPGGGAGAGTLDVRSVRSVEQANFPLALVTGAADKLALQIHHDCGRFDPPKIDRLLGHLRVMFEAIAANPEQQVSAVPLLTSVERDQLISWSGTAPPPPDEKCVHQLVEEQVLRSPDATAIVFEQEMVTYAELNRRANQLAHYLVRNGVGPETLVGIYLERSPEMVVAVLGVMKAGGAYVPLQPSLPSERLAFMLEDTRVRFVITAEPLAAGIRGYGVELISLSAEADLLESESGANPVTRVRPDNLAYVIYTSGSTGRPKGTLLQHRGVCNLVACYIKDAEIDSSAQVLQFFSFGFDGSVMEFFGALAAGATLHMAGTETVQSLQGLYDVLRDRGITEFIMTPSSMAALQPDGALKLRTVVAGGEACSAEVVARWSAPDRRFVNYYGPTECSVGAMRHVVPVPPEPGAVVPIGRPLPNLRVYLLDPDLQPVPVGAVGEIHLGGIGLARGYLNRPDLTAERFIPDPFGDGTRLYRTGDLGRYQPDGEVEFVGRIDHQVKVRGFRIELGEIEAVLRQAAGVRDAVVLAREDVPGDRRLVAYVVGDGEPQPETDALREALRSRLPEYMIPTAIVRMAELPLTSSGKVDRKALPAPDGLRPDTGVDYVAPRDPIELKLAQIWEELLDVRPIGIRDDFFELGGHSLLAIRVIARIERDLGKRPDMAALFNARTVEQLASVLRDQGATPPDTTIVGLQTRGSKRPLFFVHPSGGSVHWYANLSKRLGSKQPFYGLQARGLNGNSELHTRIEDMASYYIEAMRGVQAEGPYLLGSWSFGVIVVFEMARQLHEQGEAVERLFVVDQGPTLPFDQPEDDAAFLVQLFGDHVPLNEDELRKLDPEAQIAHVLEEAKRIDWIYPEVSLRDFRHFVRIMKTQQDAWRCYTPKPYAGRITVIRSDEQVGGRHPEPDLGWEEFAAGGVEVHEVPGDHISMMVGPGVKTLAKRIKDCLK